ncbi:MAG: hypothetical protein NXI30_05150 [bacterium]|nr:hypothetical protein [bacterium]
MAVVLTLLAGVLGCGAPTQESVSRGDAIPADALLADVLTHDEALDRIAWVAMYLSEASPGELDRIRRTFENAALDRGDVEYALFGEWWAGFDPESAFGWAEATLRARHPRVISTIVRAWARQDPQTVAASGLLFEVAPGAPIYRIDLLDALVVGWFESGQPGLADFLGSLEDASDVTQGLRTYARVRTLRDGGTAALEWAWSTPEFESDQRRLLMAGALSVVAGQDPALAAIWLSQVEADGMDVRNFVPRIARNWADHDPTAAMDWLSTLRDTADRNSAVARVAGTWSRVDPPAMTRWIDAHGGESWVDPVRIQSIRRAVNTAGEHVDWNAMLRRTEAIVDSARRSVTILWVVRKWIGVDEPAARAWINEHRELLADDQWKRITAANTDSGSGPASPTRALSPAPGPALGAQLAD